MLTAVAGNGCRRDMVGAGHGFAVLTTRARTKPEHTWADLAPVRTLSGRRDSGAFLIECRSLLLGEAAVKRGRPVEQRDQHKTLPRRSHLRGQRDRPRGARYISAVQKPQIHRVAAAGAREEQRSLSRVCCRRSDRPHRANA